MNQKKYEQLAKQGAELGIKEATEHLVEQIKASEIEVRAAAQKVVDYATQLELNWHATANLQKNLKESEDPTPKIMNFKRRMVQHESEFIKLMTYVLQLQNTINSFLGQKVQMVYTAVNPKGEVKLYEFDNTVDHLIVSQASKSHGGTFTGRIRFTKKQLEEMSPFKTDYDSTKLDMAFKAATERAKRGKKIIGAAELRGLIYIFWNGVAGWEGAQLSGLGVLGEAYFSFYINEYTFANFLEHAIGELITHPDYGAVAVDNASGFLQGDVSVANLSGGSTEYGVKAAGASALGYADIVQYANELVATTDILSYLQGSPSDPSMTGLKQRLKEEGSTKLAKKLEGTLTEAQSAILQDLQKTWVSDVNIDFKI